MRTTFAHFAAARINQNQTANACAAQFAECRSLKALFMILTMMFRFSTQKLSNRSRKTKARNPHLDYEHKNL